MGVGVLTWALVYSRERWCTDAGVGVPTLTFVAGGACHLLVVALAAGYLLLNANF